MPSLSSALKHLLHLYSVILPRVRLCVHAALLWVKFPPESVIF